MPRDKSKGLDEQEILHLMHISNSAKLAWRASSHMRSYVTVKSSRTSSLRAVKSQDKKLDEQEVECWTSCMPAHGPRMRSTTSSQQHANLTQADSTHRTACSLHL